MSVVSTVVVAAIGWWAVENPGLADGPLGPWPMLALVSFCLAAMNFVFWRHESRRFRREIDGLTAALASLNRGNLAERLPADGSAEGRRARRELNSLADTLLAYVESLQRLSTSNEELAARMRAGAVAQERQRLARDLHDSVSQQLFALVMMSDAAVAGLEAGEGPAEEDLRAIADLAWRAQTEMRALILHLRPVELDGEGLAEGIRRLVGELQSRSEVEFGLDVGELPPMPSGVENQVFRIVQEALANAMRHSGARGVSLSLRFERGEVFLGIADDGVGFDPGTTGGFGYGLEIMRERCEEIGGHMNVTSRESLGTRIDLRVPLALGEEENDG